MPWQIDPSRTNMAFEVKRLGLDALRGTFDQYAVALRAADRPFVAFDLRVDVASLDTDDLARDNRLLGEEYLDAAQHPRILYVTETLTPLHDIKDSLADATGSLLLHGVTRQVTWRIVRDSSAVRAGVETESVYVATIDLDPRDWGLPQEWPLFGESLHVTLRFAATDAGEFDIANTESAP